MARDQIQLPADGAGKSAMAFTWTEAGNPAPNLGTRYGQGFVLCDQNGNVVDILTGAPAGSERGVGVRQIGTAAVGGDVAPAGIESGNPIKIGGRVSPGTPASTASGQRVEGHFDAYGRLGIWLAGKGSANAMTVNADGSALVDASDRAVREVGRVRIWDGADEATVIPRGTVPTANDKGMCVVSLNVPRPAYQVVTGEITSGTAVAVANPLTIWHPVTLTKDVFITEIGVNVRIVQTAGTYAFELSFISAEAATPGGTTLTPQQLDRSQPASGLTVRQSPTGAPTLTGQIFQRAAQALPAAAVPQISNYDGIVVYRARDLDDYSDAILLRNGQAEGIVIRQNIITTLSTAPVFSVYARYVERA